MGSFIPFAEKYVCEECFAKLQIQHNNYIGYINNKPKTLNILGVPYSVTYCDNVLDVDPNKRETLFGYCDHQTQTIRIFDKDCKIEFVWQSIIHEVLHLIGDNTNISIFDIIGKDGEQKHKEIDCLANVFSDFLFRNNLIKLYKEAS